MLDLPRLKRFAAAGLALLLAGCAWPEPASAPQSPQTEKAGGSMPRADESGRPLTPAEERMRAQSRNFDRTVWEGVLFGTAVGAVGRGVAKGAGIGAVAGGVTSLYVAVKQLDYAQWEDQLESMIADVKQTNREIEELIEAARTVASEDKRKLTAVNERYRQGLITLQGLHRARAAMVENQKIMLNAVEGAREKKRIFRSAEEQYKAQHPNVDTRQMRYEIESLSNQIDTLDAIVGELDVA